MSEIVRIAAAHPPEAAHTPAEERQRYFTAAQQQAWTLRFERPAFLKAQIPVTTPTE